MEPQQIFIQPGITIPSPERLILLSISALLSKLVKYNTIIVSILNTSSYASRKFGITQETVGFIESLDPRQRVILNVAGVPYALERFPEPGAYQCCFTFL